VLSEEGKDDTARLSAARVWIVDPLDGTREFGEDGRSDWAVHVALVIDNAVHAAAVALPARGLTLSTARPLPPPGPSPGRPRLVVSRTRPPAVTETVREALDGELVPLGSAGAKAMAVVLGEADVYVHAGGQYEWDSAAPVGVAAAAGLHVSRIDGSRLRYNQRDVWLPDLVVCRPELAEAVLEAAAGLHN
jgi:3'(2'), 5'-bisphosphate nucleotidase